MTNIVAFSKEHAREAAALHADAFHRSWSVSDMEGYADHENSFGYSALKKNKLVGFILVRKVLQEAEILTLVVCSKHRNQGIGKLLLKYILNFLLLKGIQTVYLEVKQDNQSAIELYEKTGFSLDSTRPGYYPTANGAKIAGLNYRKCMETDCFS